MSGFMASAIVIARRDFLSIVGTPTFLLFLLAPFFMLSFGLVGGLGASRVATSVQDKARLVVIATPADIVRLKRADGELRELFRTIDAPPPIVYRTPESDLEAQAQRLFDDSGLAPSALLYGPLDAPQVRYDAIGARSARYLAGLAERALRDAREPVSTPLSKPAIREVPRGAATDGGRQSTGFAAVFVIFLLTLLLAGQAVGMLAEEKSNKVIEVLAAAAPLEAVFFGKLIGLFGVALVFVAFWGTLGGGTLVLLPDRDQIVAGLQPAVGLVPFLLLGACYFTMAYMLLGAIFLGVGAQAATMREIQMLSLPITIFQVAMFGLSTAAAGDPGSDIARFAEWFPFSSPFAMAARAATDPAITPHLLALAWQSLWVAATIWVAARLFRTGVLKAGGGWRLGLTRKTVVSAE